MLRLLEVWTTVSVQGAGVAHRLDIALDSGATISGTVFDSETGLPIADAEVYAENSDGGPGSWANTNRDGFYTLEAVAPGTYRIGVRAERQGYVEQLFDDALSWDDAELIFVRGSEGIDGIDFGLRLGGTIEGVVRDAQTQLPVAGVEVIAAPVDGDDIAWTSTDGNGRYALRGVPAGPIVVKVYSESHVDARTRVEVAGPGLVTTANFALSPGATISGRITDADTGLAIAGVRVKASNIFDAPGAEGYSDADGVYTVKGVAPGTYRIRARAQGRGYIQQYHDGEIYRDKATEVAVSGTEEVHGIDFVLKRGATISGRVVDASTGLPISNMEIHAGPRDGEHLAWEYTQGDGTYVLRGMPDGLIEVEVGGQGYVHVTKTVIIRDGQDVTNFDF